MIRIANYRPSVERVLAGLALLLAWTTASAIPTQSPLLSRDGVAGSPNVMFTLDDSGSMEWYYMPDNHYVGTSGTNGYEEGWDPSEVNSWPWDKSRFIATTQDSYTVRNRSSDFNLVYYNPAIRYVPWANSDGSSMPDSPPTAAWVEPMAHGRGTADLTGVRNQFARWCTASGCSNQTLQYAPATYFVHNGGSFSSAGNYTRVRIADAASFTRPDSRTDCAPAGAGLRSCSQAQEYQNFANWFTYYRKRIFIAIGGTTRAFAAQGEGMRVGYGSINKGSSSVDSVSTPVVERGVRPFAGADRDAFFSWLSTQFASGGTPLRRAMDYVGQYYERTDNRGPWGERPGFNDGTEHLACRKSYHILMTDGYWNGSSPVTAGARANVDNGTGPLITGPGGKTFRYTAMRPFRDNTSSTLADVAMYYWYRDLRPDLANRVTPDTESPAFWQNVVQFTVGFGVNGTLNPETDLPALESGALSWPSVSGGSNTTIDDLWHAAVNSRGQYLNASDPEQFATSLTSILQQISERQSAEGGAAVTSSTLEADTTKFIPSYQSGKWTGEVFAKRLDANGLPVGDLWLASRKVPDPAARNLWLGRGGNATPVPFRWDSLTASEQAALGPLASADLIDYFRGVRALEGTTYRVRDANSVLGDFVNSTPVLIGDLLNEQYQFLPDGAPGKSTYRAFLDQKKSRPKVLFVGANDGMLHAFSATTGAELFGFVPQEHLRTIGEYAQPSYQHRFYVDGPMVEADAYLGSWRNLLLGSMGAGGTSIFAMDVTNTASFGASTVRWEFDHQNMGYTFSPPAVGVTTGGTWVAVFGNGVDSKGADTSAANKARLFVVNLSTGALLKQINLPGNRNGLGGVRLVKNAHNQIVAGYAGDLQGNLWRFDMSDPLPGAWSLGMGGQPLYTAKSSNTDQPILGTPEYVVHPQGGQMVIFGTGQLFMDEHLTDTSLQSLYGIWDKKAGDLDSIASDRVTASDSIVAQRFTGTVGTGADEYYLGTNDAIDWSEDRGWRLDLTIMAGQRMLYQPVLVRGYVLFNTVVPGSGGSSAGTVADACEGGGSTGINVLINALNGGQSVKPIIDTNGDGEITDADQMVSGYKTQADGSDTIMYGKDGTIVIQRALGQTTAQLQGRALERTWRQLMTIPR
ncbi:MAG: PilC/PilY family type IV pilus protein [Burkholderiaceae bacterium]